jgi:O-antigen ligase
MGLYVIIIGLIERLMHPELMYRLQGPFYDRDALYMTMAVVFFIVLLDSDVFGSSKREKKQALPQGIRWFVIFLAPVIIALTLTRGDWLGFVVGLCIFLFLSRRAIKASRALITVGAAMVLIPVLLIALQNIVPEEVIEKRIQDSDNVLGRYATWLASVGEATRQPIFGIGLNNLRDSLAKIEMGFGNATNYATVHNSFLSLFVELGATGLLAYLGMVASIIRMGINLYRTGQYARDQCRGAAVIAIMLAYLIPAMFANILYVTICLMHVYVFVVLGAISGVYGPRGQSLATYYSSEDCWGSLPSVHLGGMVRSRAQTDEHWFRT